MTRGNQRETDRAKAQARNAKNAKKEHVSASAKNTAQMTNAEIMREKQRRADLKKQGIDPDAEVEKPTKTWDDSYLKQYEIDDNEEENCDNSEFS